MNDAKTQWDNRQTAKYEIQQKFQQRLIQQLIALIDAHTTARHGADSNHTDLNRKLSSNTQIPRVTPIAAKFLSTTDSAIRRQWIESEQVDCIIYLPTADLNEQAQAILLLRSPYPLRTQHSILLINVFRRITDQPHNHQAQNPLNPYTDALIDEILSIYRQVRYPIQPETELRSPVCYAAEFSDPSYGMRCNGKAYLATTTEMMHPEFNWEFSE